MADQDKTMAVRPNVGVQIQTMADLYRFGQWVVQSGMCPKHYTKPEQVVIAVQMGFEVGLPPMQAVQSIAVIGNRPAIWGDARNGIIMRSGLMTKCRRWFTGDGDTRTAHCCMGRRSGGVEIEDERSFGIADARRAGLLGKDTYKAYTDDMLMRRATWRVQSFLFSDLMAGMIPADIDEYAAPARDVTEGATVTTLDTLADRLADSLAAAPEPAGDAQAADPSTDYPEADTEPPAPAEDAPWEEETPPSPPVPAPPVNPTRTEAERSEWLEAVQQEMDRLDLTPAARAKAMRDAGMTSTRLEKATTAQLSGMLDALRAR